MPPRVHPGMRRRESKHVPIHSSRSHYRHRDDGVKAVDRLEDARLTQRSSSTRGKPQGGPGSDNGGLDASAPTFSKHVDYFERLHMARARKARDEDSAKVKRLNRCDGSGWTNRVTTPVAFQFNNRPVRTSIKALQRPISARQPASLSNSVSSLQSFMAANQGLYRYAEFNADTPLGGPGPAEQQGQQEDQYGDGGFVGYEGYYQPSREFGDGVRGARVWDDPPPDPDYDHYLDEGDEDGGDRRYDDFTGDDRSRGGRGRGEVGRGSGGRGRRVSGGGSGGEGGGGEGGSYGGGESRDVEFGSNERRRGSRGGGGEHRGGDGARRRGTLVEERTW